MHNRKEIKFVSFRQHNKVTEEVVLFIQNCRNFFSTIFSKFPIDSFNFPLTDVRFASKKPGLHACMYIYIYLFIYLFYTYIVYTIYNIYIIYNIQKVSELYSQIFLAVSISTGCYTINLARILSQDYRYCFCINFFFVVPFLIAYQDFFANTFCCSLTYPFICL